MEDPSNNSTNRPNSAKGGTLGGTNASPESVRVPAGSWPSRPLAQFEPFIAGGASAVEIAEHRADASGYLFDAPAPRRRRPRAGPRARGAAVARLLLLLAERTRSFAGLAAAVATGNELVHF